MFWNYIVALSNSQGSLIHSRSPLESLEFDMICLSFHSRLPSPSLHSLHQSRMLWMLPFHASLRTLVKREDDGTKPKLKRKDWNEMRAFCQHTYVKKKETSKVNTVTQKRTLRISPCLLNVFHNFITSRSCFLLKFTRNSKREKFYKGKRRVTFKQGQETESKKCKVYLDVDKNNSAMTFVWCWYWRGNTFYPA